MKKSIIALALLLCLGLSGCGEILAGSYQVSSPHVDRPATDEDSSAIRVENYRDLVSAVLYLVSQGESEGTLQFYDYPGDVETAVASACLEVATQDPLGAYCVDYIRHETTRVVSYDQTTLSIHYRRTMEQVRSMVNVTGTSAIRTELQEALVAFQKEVVLRVAYFAENVDSITQLIRQAYYDDPAHALGFPQVEINLYPNSGSQRVVEILLTYPEDVEELERKSEKLADVLEVDHFADTNTQGMDQVGIAQYVLDRLPYLAEYDPEAGATVYDVLVEERANSEGLALAYVLFCSQLGEAPACEVVEGTLLTQEEPDPEGPGAFEPVELTHFWVSLRFSDGETLYLDPSNEELSPSTAQEMFDAGYRWPGGPEEIEAVEETVEDLAALSQEQEGSPQNEVQDGE